MAIQVAIVFIVFIISVIIAYLVGLNAQIKAMRDHLAATAARADVVLKSSPDVHQRLTRTRDTCNDKVQAETVSAHHHAAHDQQSTLNGLGWHGHW